MNKKSIINRLTKQIAEELAAITAAAKATYDIATNEDNKPENKYDTRSLEASYLAGAQAERVADMKEVHAIFENLPLKEFNENSKISSTALVELNQNEKITFVLIMPKGGGQTCKFEGQQIQVITAESPLGKALIGKCCGDFIDLETGSTRREYEIISVS